MKDKYMVADGERLCLVDGERWRSFMDIDLLEIKDPIKDSNDIEVWHKKEMWLTEMLGDKAIVYPHIVFMLDDVGVPKRYHGELRQEEK